MTPTIPAYLQSTCIEYRDICKNPACPEAIKQNPETGRYFITMGHCGFNTKANNAQGYTTEKRAFSILCRYLLADHPKQ